MTRVKATRDYVAENDSQLSFSRGAVMFVAAQVDAQWFQGTLVCKYMHMCIVCVCIVCVCVCVCEVIYIYIYR